LIIDEIIEEEVDIKDLVYDDGNGEEILYGDGNETLVVTKSLLAPKDDSWKNWLRTNIFHTTRMIVEQVFKVIIDGGSCENMVFGEEIKKL